MPSLETVWLVAGAAALLWVLPGPALLLLLTRGLDLGPRGAVATAVGLAGGTAVHVVAAALGLSAVLATSATAFTTVKVLGGVYLVWLGVQRLRDPTPVLGGATSVVTTDPGGPGAVAPPTVAAGRPPGGTRRALAEGFTINALNPKVAVFFLAFLPPFVDPDRGAVLLQTVALGAVVVAVLLAGDALFGAATGRLGRAWVRRVLSERTDRRARRAIGGVYVGLGVLAVASGDGSGG